MQLPETIEILLSQYQELQTKISEKYSEIAELEKQKTLLRNSAANLSTQIFYAIQAENLFQPKFQINEIVFVIKPSKYEWVKFKIEYVGCLASYRFKPEHLHKDWDPFYYVLVPEDCVTNDYELERFLEESFASKDLELVTPEKEQEKIAQEIKQYEEKISQLKSR